MVLLALAEAEAEAEAVDLGLGDVRPGLVPREGEEDDQHGEAQGVWHQRSDQDELGELLRRPCPLQIPAALVQGQSGYGEGEDVALD